MLIINANIMFEFDSALWFLNAGSYLLCHLGAPVIFVSSLCQSLQTAYHPDESLFFYHIHRPPPSGQDNDVAVI